jgi:putative membrane protein
MMGHWYGLMGAGDWVLMSVFWVALIALLAWVFASLVGRSERGSSDSGERPEEILDRRLARGEIDTQTYNTLRDTLREAQTGKG